MKTLLLFLLISAIVRASPSAVIEGSNLVRERAIEASKKSGHSEVPVDLAVSLEAVRRCEIRIQSMWIAAHENGFKNGPAMLSGLRELEGATTRLLSQIEKIGAEVKREHLDNAVKKAAEARDAFRKRVSTGAYP